MSRPSWILGHVLDRLAEIPDGTVHTTVTSPPYFGLRDYGTEGQDWPKVRFAPMPGLPPMTIPAMRCSLGNEPDPWAYVGHLVLVFRGVRRVLRGDGTLWLNLGDSYASTSTYNAPRTSAGAFGRVESDRQPNAKIPAGLKPKDLLGIPWRAAFALQADGWYLRMDNVWAKPNPMPESVTDRPTKAHEMVFLLSKSERYAYDADAVREPHETPEDQRASKSGRSAMRGQAAIRARGNLELSDAPEDRYFAEAGRNKRSVWTIATHAFPSAHFATMPPALAEPCILAGSPRDGVVLDPFGGAGTTALVSVRNGRRPIHIELNPDYLAIAKRRVEDDAPLFNRRTA